MNSDEKKQWSIDEFVDTADTKFDEIEFGGGFIKIGSCSTADILQWIDESDNPVKKRTSGIRLLVASFINPDGTRVPHEDRERYVEMIAKRRDATENGRAIARVMELNGLKVPGTKALTLLKNVSREASTGASPSDSPSLTESPTSIASSGN